MNYGMKIYFGRKTGPEGQAQCGKSGISNKLAQKHMRRTDPDIILRHYVP